MVSKLYAVFDLLAGLPAHCSVRWGLHRSSLTCCASREAESSLPASRALASGRRALFACDSSAAAEIPSVVPTA